MQHFPAVSGATYRVTTAINAGVGDGILIPNMGILMPNMGNWEKALEKTEGKGVRTVERIYRNKRIGKLTWLHLCAEK